MKYSNLCFQFQRLGGPLPSLAKGEHVKAIGQFETDPFPDKHTWVRMYEEDHISSDRVWRGKAGANEWWHRWQGAINKAPWAHCFHTGNEPQPMHNHDFRRLLDTYTAELAWIGHNEGFKIAGHNWSVGLPPDGTELQFAKSLEALHKYDHYLVTHEYGAPFMQYQEWDPDKEWGYWWCGKILRMIAKWEAAGIPIPNIGIGEAGIDLGVRNKANPIVRPQRGYKSVTTALDYMVQLAWYDALLYPEPRIKAIFPFITLPEFQWLDFAITHELTILINNHIDTWEPAIVVEPPVVNPKPPMRNVTKQMRKHPTLKFPRRKPADVALSVLHYSGVKRSPGPIVPHLRAMSAYHIRRWDWPGMAYTYVVGDDVVDEQGNAKNATIFQTNWPGRITFHSGNEAANNASVGVCVLLAPEEIPHPRQCEPLRDLLRWLGHPVQLHKEIVATQCPGKAKRCVRSL